MLYSQPGWIGVGGQLNYISRESVENCLKYPDKYKLQYITIALTLNQTYNEKYKAFFDPGDL